VPVWYQEEVEKRHRQLRQEPHIPEGRIEEPVIIANEDAEVWDVGCLAKGIGRKVPKPQHIFRVLYIAILHYYNVYKYSIVLLPLF
jgi:hypothetical protein